MRSSCKIATATVPLRAGSRFSLLSATGTSTPLRTAYNAQFYTHRSFTTSVILCAQKDSTQAAEKKAAKEAKKAAKKAVADAGAKEVKEEKKTKKQKTAEESGEDKVVKVKKEKKEKKESALDEDKAARKEAKKLEKKKAAAGEGAKEASVDELDLEADNPDDGEELNLGDVARMMEKMTEQGTEESGSVLRLLGAVAEAGKDAKRWGVFKIHDDGSVQVVETFDAEEQAEQFVELSAPPATKEEKKTKKTKSAASADEKSRKEKREEKKLKEKAKKVEKAKAAEEKKLAKVVAKAKKSATKSGKEEEEVA